jgi:ribosomal protein S27E
MEIIKRGVIPEERVYYAKCGYCESELRFRRSEAKYVSDQRDGDYLVVKCPVCSKSISTPEYYKATAQDYYSK